MTRKNKKLLFQMIDDLYNTREGKMKKKLAVFLLNTEKMKLYWIFLNATFWISTNNTRHYTMQGLVTDFERKWS